MAGTLYKEWLTEEKLEVLKGWARNGLTNEEIAENIGISRQTFQKWLKKYPKIAEAVRQSKEEADLRVENATFRRALGYTAKIQKFIKVKKVEYENGKRIAETEELVPVEEEVHVPADVKAQIFWLQHRKTEAWGKAAEETGNPEGENPVVEIPGVVEEVAEPENGVAENE